MAQVKLGLKTVTPLFLSGAEARGEPELRPPSFRGALRYWLRAALGGAIGDRDLPHLHKLEGQVFGNAADDTGGQASAVTIQISNDAGFESDFYHKEPTERVRRNGESLPQPSGRDYLFWSMDESGRDDNYQPPKQYIKNGTTFTLTLRNRPGSDDQALVDSVATLWLLLNLGGLGSRSRRAAGSLAVCESIVQNGLKFGQNLNTLNDFAQYLGTGLSEVRNVFKRHGQAHVSRPSEFDVLHPETCRVWVLGMWPSAEEAVKTIGAAMRDFRNRSEPDHQQVAEWVRGKPIDTVHRAAFGLPLPFNYSNGPRGIVVQGRLKPKEQQVNRRASPLWLKVSRLNEQQYVGVATVFYARFLAAGESLHTSKAKTAVPPPSDYSLIENWLSDKDMFPQGTAVEYA